MPSLPGLPGKSRRACRSGLSRAEWKSSGQPRQARATRESGAVWRETNRVQAPDRRPIKTAGATTPGLCQATTHAAFEQATSFLLPWLAVGKLPPVCLRATLREPPPRAGHDPNEHAAGPPAVSRAIRFLFRREGRPQPQASLLTYRMTREHADLPSGQYGRRRACGVRVQSRGNLTALRCRHRVRKDLLFSGGTAVFGWFDPSTAYFRNRDTSARLGHAESATS